MEQLSAVVKNLTLLNHLHLLYVQKITNDMKHRPITQYYLTLLNYLSLFFKL